MGNALTTGNNKVLVNNPNFNFQTFVNQQNLSPALEKLSNHICTSAFHNSDEFDPVKCHPGTRVSILSLLEEWALTKALNAEDGITPMIWLHGTAGVGKTAIAKSFAERLDSLGRLAASFFFWRADPGRSDDTNFVSTLAYQLALSIPPLRSHIEDAIASDPAIFGRTPKIQVDSLILKPLRCLTDYNPDLDVHSLPNVLIIDGLDECGGLNQNRIQFQRRAFEIIHSLTLQQDLFPFRVLVLSRVNQHIRILFEGPDMRDMSRSIFLEEGLVPVSDIELYIDAQFNAIKTSHPDRASLPEIWPEYRISNRLARCANGQFIFAATVMGFIADLNHRPSKQLELVVNDLMWKDSPEGFTVFKPLYSLYRHVIDSVIPSSRKAAFDVISFHIAHASESDFYSRIRIPDVEDLLGFREGDLRHCLRDFEAIFSLELMEGSQDVYYLEFKHTTFIDFLFDEEHAGDWYIDLYAVKEKYAMMDMEMFEKGQALSIETQTYWFYCLQNALQRVIGPHSGRPRSTERVVPTMWIDKWKNLWKYDVGLLFLQRSGCRAGALVRVLLDTFCVTATWDRVSLDWSPDYVNVWDEVVLAFCSFFNKKMKPYEKHGLLYALLLTYVYDWTIPTSVFPSFPRGIVHATQRSYNSKYDWTPDSYCSFLREYIKAKIQDDLELRTIDQNSLQLLDSPHNNPNTCWLLTIVPLFYLSSFGPKQDEDSFPLGHLPNDDALLRALTVIYEVWSLKGIFMEVWPWFDIIVSLCCNQNEKTLDMVNSDDFPLDMKRDIAVFCPWVTPPPGTDEPPSHKLSESDSSELDDFIAEISRCRRIPAFMFRTRWLPRYILL
ncbi:hypothetical protein CVT24_002256 [Panaeolus cyanescens]|uniref:Nephrocystin 3-like N-terminal domain-containing protein n=1 Tax=Panaeolus cyanescens TaxID=181874 RepID=A0A409YIH3_9AGAR|nr:hypothetical protein CVT24_002256 [Panaeolus cyanescens]